MVRLRLAMQHHFSVQGWCATARVMLLLLENPPACHQLGGFRGMLDVTVYLCPFRREHLIDRGNVLSQHVDNKHLYLNSDDS